MKIFFLAIGSNLIACQQGILFAHRLHEARALANLNLQENARPALADSVFSQFPFNLLGAYFRWFEVWSAEQERVVARPISLAERMRRLRALR